MENKYVDIYNIKPRFDKAFESIDNWDISEKNKHFIKEFIRFIIAEGISDKRKLKYIYTLKTISYKLGMDFDKVTKEDVVKLFEYIQNNGYKPNTVKDFKSVIKRFYKVLFGDNEEYPREVKWLKINVKLSDQGKNHPLTEDDVKKIIEVVDQPMYRCLIALAFESCCRPSEYLTLRLKDIKENEHGFEMTVSGKTRTRYLNQTSTLTNFRKNPRHIFLSTLIKIIKENPQLWSSGRESYEENIAFCRIERMQKKYRNKFIHTKIKEDKDYSWLRKKQYPFNIWEAREMFRHTFFILDSLYKKNKKYSYYLSQIKTYLQ